MTETKAKADTKETIHDFKQAVNMSATELARWLKTDESRSVGQTKDGENEAIGHQSGRKIIHLLETRETDYTEADLAHMRKVVSYVRRHTAQGPTKSDVETSHWRYSLMNWGHDPCK